MTISNQATLLVTIGIVAVSAADISASCVTEGLKFGNNAELSAARDQVITTPKKSGNTLTLTYSNTAPVATACGLAGGVYKKFDYDASCVDNGKSSKLKVIDAPLCIGKSCTGANIRELEEELDDIIEDAGDLLGADTTCSGGFGASASLALGVVMTAAWHLL